MKYIVSILLLFLSASVSAQQNTIDSLELLLLDLKESDTNKVIVLNELSWKYLVKNPVESQNYAKTAIRLAKNISFTKGEVTGNYLLGDTYFRQADYASAIRVATNTLKLATQIKDYNGIFESYYLMGNIYNFGLKNYDEALEYYLKALKIAEKVDNREKVAAIKSSTSWVYAVTGENLENAHQLIDEAILTCKTLDLKRFLSYCYNSKGLIFLSQNKSDSAFHYINLSNYMARQVDDFAVIAYNGSALGQIAIEQKRFNDAVIIFQQTLDKGRKVNAYQVVFEAYKGLAEAYHLQTNYRQAYNYQRLTSEMQDSLRGVIVEQNIAVTQEIYEKEKQEAQIKFLEEQNALIAKEKKNQIILFLIILGFAAIVILLVLRNNGQKKKSNIILTQKNKEIAKQAKELKDSNQKLVALNEFKESMTGMIVHDLKNPLNAIISLTENNFKMENKILMNQYGKSMLNLVTNILEVQKFEQAEIILTIESQKLITIIESAISEVSLLIEDKNHKINIEADRSIWVKVDTTLMKRVFVNLLTNAIKYTPVNGEITFTSKVINNLWVEASVKDTGAGISETDIALIFNKFKQLNRKNSGKTRSTGLGLTFCKMAIEAHGGEISVDSKVNKGTAFIFTLPHSYYEIIEDPKSDSIEESNILVNHNAFDINQLTTEEREYISKFLSKINRYEVYDTSAVLSIIKDIDSDNKTIMKWSEALEQTLYTSNDKQFRALTSF